MVADDGYTVPGRLFMVFQWSLWILIHDQRPLGPGAKNRCAPRGTRWLLDPIISKKETLAFRQPDASLFGDLNYTKGCYTGNTGEAYILVKMSPVMRMLLDYIPFPRPLTEGLDDPHDIAWAIRRVQELRRVKRHLFRRVKKQLKST